jgi:TolA-binding protein
VAAAAAVLLVFVFGFTEDTVEPNDAPGRVADAEDETSVFEVALTREQVDGASRLRLESGSRVHVDGGAKLDLVKADPSTTRFALNSGRAVFEVDRLAAEQQFIVDVPGGQIRVLGTVFCVDVENGRLDLRVAEGVVYYRADHGRGETIRAGQALGADGAIRELERAELAELEQVFGDEDEQTKVEPAEVEVAIEHPRDVGQRPSRDAVDEQEPGSEPEEAIEAVEVQIDPVQQELEPEIEAVPTIAELMSRAAELRAGARWIELVEVYRDVVRLYPRSAEAQTCFVLMGNVQLKQVRNYAAALKSYKSYLTRSPDGSLAEEADWGVAVAYRKLGQREQERAALTRFAKRHPGSPFAPVVEERLIEITGADGK